MTPSDDIEARHLWWLVREHSAAVALQDVERIGEIFEAIRIHGELAVSDDVKAACQRLVDAAAVSSMVKLPMTAMTVAALGQSPRLH